MKVELLIDPKNPVMRIECDGTPQEIATFLKTFMSMPVPKTTKVSTPIV